MHSQFYMLMIVFLTGMFGIWKAIPVGLAFNMEPAGIFLMTAAGASSAAFIIYFSGSSIRNFLLRNKKEKSFTKHTRAKKLLDKYGIAGLGFFGTLLMGPNMTMIIGLMISGSGKKLLFWTIAGIVVWSLCLTFSGIKSIEIFQRIRDIL